MALLLLVASVSKEEGARANRGGILLVVLLLLHVLAPVLEWVAGVPVLPVLVLVAAEVGLRENRGPGFVQEEEEVCLLLLLLFIMLC